MGHVRIVTVMLVRKQPECVRVEVWSVGPWVLLSFVEYLVLFNPV